MKNRIYIITVFSVCYCIVPVYLYIPYWRLPCISGFYFILFYFEYLFIYFHTKANGTKWKQKHFHCEIPKTKYKLLDFVVTCFSCLYLCPFHQQCESSFSVDFPFKVQPWETILWQQTSCWADQITELCSNYTVCLSMWSSLCVPLCVNVHWVHAHASTQACTHAHTNLYVCDSGLDHF